MLRLGWAVALALALASYGCHKAAAVDCTPPAQPLVASEAGCPSFTAEVLPEVFVPVCQNCHRPGGEEPTMPFFTYQQISAKAGTIFNDVFELCSMPPSNAPEPLTDGERQTLLDWYACGALDDSPAADAGAGD